MTDALPTRLSAIALAKDGDLVEVSGHAGPVGAPAVAPLAGGVCALAVLTALEQRQRGRDVYWDAVLVETIGAGIAVHDSSGKAVALAGAWHLDLVTLPVHSQVFDDVPAPLEEILARSGRSSRAGFFRRRMRFDEVVIDRGDPLVLVGRGRWEADPDPSAHSQGGDYRSLPRRLLLRGTAAEPVTVRGLSAARAGPRP